MGEEPGARRTDADGFAAQVSDVSVLADPVRRALYEYVVAQPEPVGRAQAAAATDLPEHTAKFHLDRLVESGLLATEFRRLTGRRGPGAGRPSKLYRRSDRQVELSLPQRRYELAGQVLATAVSRSASDGGTGHATVLDDVREAAHAAGRDLAAKVPPPEQGTADLTTVARALADVGYEPRADDDQVILANCPFHGLVDQHRSLVCTMNLALLEGVLEGLHCEGAQARLDPAPGRCCVTIARASRG